MKTRGCTGWECCHGTTLGTGRGTRRKSQTNLPDTQSQDDHDDSLRFPFFNAHVSPCLTCTCLLTHIAFSHCRSGEIMQRDDYNDRHHHSTLGLGWLHIDELCNLTSHSNVLNQLVTSATLTCSFGFFSLLFWFSFSIPLVLALCSPLQLPLLQFVRGIW
jgi:hypothetical protein